MFRVGDRVRKVRGQFGLGATGIVTELDPESPDGHEAEIRCDVPIIFTISGRPFRQTAGNRLWIRVKEWQLIEYDGNQPGHWSAGPWSPHRGWIWK